MDGVLKTIGHIQLAVLLIGIAVSLDVTLAIDRFSAQKLEQPENLPDDELLTGFRVYLQGEIDVLRQEVERASGIEFENTAHRLTTLADELSDIAGVVPSWEICMDVSRSLDMDFDESERYAYFCQESKQATLKASNLVASAVRLQPKTLEEWPAENIERATRVFHAELMGLARVARDTWIAFVEQGGNSRELHLETNSALNKLRERARAGVTREDFYVAEHLSLPSTESGQAYLDDIRTWSLLELDRRIGDLSESLSPDNPSQKVLVPTPRWLGPKAYILVFLLSLLVQLVLVNRCRDHYRDQVPTEPNYWVVLVFQSGRVISAVTVTLLLWVPAMLAIYARAVSTRLDDRARTIAEPYPQSSLFQFADFLGGRIAVSISLVLAALVSFWLYRLYVQFAKA